MGRLIGLSLLTLVLLIVGVHSCDTSPARMAERLLLADINAEDGLAYRDAQQQRPEIATLPSGLQFEVLSPGQGAIPEPDDWVEVHYRGWHIDGREFASSWREDQPATVAISKTIAGWREALIMMPVGTRVRLILPPNLAYGRSGGGAIGPEETLVFELELRAIVAAPEVVGF